MDDFPADNSTPGTYTVFDSPIAARIETEGDEDWIRVQGMRKFFAYDVWLYRSTDDDFISFADLSMYGPSSQLVWDPLGTERVPGREIYIHRGNNVDQFISVGSSQVGNYRLYIAAGDFAGNTLAEATNFAPTRFNQFASALENNADTDFLRYRLFAGTEYSFNLLGSESNETHDTTLARKSLRLFDLDGTLIAEDDASAEFRSASITFTPDETAEYIFEIDSDAATGSYILESDQLDDFRGDVNTEGVLPTDGTPVSGQSNHDFLDQFGGIDQDWFRFEPQAGFRYDIESSNTSLSLRNQAGDFIDVNYTDGPTGIITGRFAFTPQSEGPFYVASGAIGAGLSEYSLTANVVDDHIATLRDATRFSNSGSSVGTIGGAIETQGDRDWILFGLARFANYRFTVDADPSLRMAVSIRDEDGDVVGTGTAFQPLNFSYESQTADNKQFYVDVRSNASSTGAWTLRSQALQGGNDASTRWNVNLSSGFGRIRSLARQSEGTELWHRFEVSPNTWYEIESNQVSFQVRIDNENAAVVNYDRGKRYYFSGSSSDTNRYLVVDQGEQPGTETGFEIKFAKDARLRLPSIGQFSPDITRFGNRVFGFREVEVYSSVPFTYIDGDATVSVSARDYVTLNHDQWFSIQLDANTFNDVGDLFYRDLRPNGNSQWSAMELYLHHLPEGVSQTTLVQFFGQRNFAFADGRPAYLAADDPVVGETTPLTEDERSAMRNAFFQWSRHTPFSLTELTDPGASNDAAPIMVYKAEIDSDVLAFSSLDDPSGEGLAGDIILNVNSPLWDDFSKGTQGPFELLRAVGTSIGAPELANIGIDRSVMGANQTDLVAFPSTLLPIDINGLRFPGKIDLHPQTNVKQEFSLDESMPIFETIIHSGPTDGSLISAARSDLEAVIDLRPGQRSFLRDGDANWIMSEFSIVNVAVGGSNGDFLRGNHYDNVLLGNDGNDALSGGVGDDFLSGGAGNDSYFYFMGHGNDFINEAEGGGTDTLNIQGLKNFDGIEDLRFRRFGNNLKITLELDGPDRNADSIIIRDMGTPESAVEQLAMAVGSNIFENVSLQSVWTQTDQQLRRFELAAGSDAFGRLVSPV